MDNNKFIGFTLIMLLIITYYTLFPPGQVENYNETVDKKEEIELIESEKDEKKIKSENIINSDFSIDKYNPIEEIVSIENENLIIEFTSKGGKILNVYLKKYLNPSKEKVNIYNGLNGDINFIIDDDEKVNLDEIIFDYQKSNNNDKKTLVFTASSKSGKKITLRYEIINDEYLVNSSIILNENFSEASNLNFSWINKLNHQESNFKNEKNQSRINYFSFDDEFDYTSSTSVETEEISINKSLKWISSKQQFFNSSIISENGLLNSNLKSEYIESEDYVKMFRINSQIPIVNNTISFKYFFGPNKYSILENVADGFDNNLYLGWIGVGGFNKYIIVAIFNFLEKITNNYGLIIFLMVILIRIVVTPLTYKSHLSMAKMKVLNPEIKLIREKHDGDMQKSQSEIMELYQKTGVSPLGGCLPILFQLPILVSVFYFLPNAIELRGKSFLWASDLSNYDSILNLPFNIPFYGDHISLFTVLMTVSTILINKANSQMQTIEGPMKTFQYVFPILFLFIFNNFSSGLTYYYFLSNVASYGQIFIFKRFVDEEKIKKEIDFNRKRNLNTKKSSFQIKLEEAMKARQGANNKKNK